MKSKDLQNLTDTIYKSTMKLDDDLKVKLLEYGTLKSNLAQMDRREAGAITVRPLDGIIKKEHIIDTENIATVFIVCLKENYKHWSDHYEKYGETTELPAVVPESSTIIKEEGEYYLLSCQVLKKLLQDFKTAVDKDKKAKIRDFVFDEQRSKLSEMEKLKLEDTKKEMKNNLINLCTSDFSEAFINWMHLKCIRVFVESILRYGVPPNFFVVLIKVEGHERKF